MTSAHRAMSYSYRVTLRTLVYRRVYHVFRTYPQFAQFRLRFPVISPIQVMSWQTYTNDVRANSTTVARDWMPSWVTSWLTPPTPETPGGASSGGDNDNDKTQRDPKQLTVKQLVDMLNNSYEYVVHRTDNYAAGTCKAPLLAEEDPHKRKNPMAPHGIYATVGVSGLDYGPFGVVFMKNVVHWSKHEGPVVIFRGDMLDPSQAEGWYHVDDLKKAQQNKG